METETIEKETMICRRCGDTVVIKEIEEHVKEKHFRISFE